MTTAIRLREMQASILPVSCAVAAGVILTLACASGSGMKIPAVALGVVAGVVLAIASGNPRLMMIWGYGLTFPLSLSKYFGLNTYKGGGETAFRIDASDVFIFLLAGWLVWEVWTNRRPGVLLPRVLIPYFILMLWGVAEVLGGHWRLFALHELSRMLKQVLAFIVLVNEMNRPRRVLQFMGAVLLGAVVNAGVAIGEYWFHRSFGLDFLGETSTRQLEILAATSVQSARVFRVSGFLLHPNLLGIYLAVLLPFAVAVFLLHASKLTRFAAFIAAVLCGLALVLTLSRSSWGSAIAAIVALFCLLPLHRSLRRRSAVAAAVSVMALCIVGIAFYGPITTRLFDSKDDATTGREAFVVDAKALIDSSPAFGTGFNGYSFNVRDFMKTRFDKYEGGWIPPVHNIYYLWWAETGYVGLGVFLFMWAWIIWISIQNLRVQDEVMFAANVACLSGMLGFVLDGFFSFTLRVTPTLKEFWALAAIILAVRYWRGRNSPVRFTAEVFAREEEVSLAV